MATVLRPAQDFQQDPQMLFQESQQGQQGRLPNQQGLQQNQQTQPSNQQYPQQLNSQAFQQPVCLPPKNTFRTRNPTCFWALIIIIGLIVITIISSIITYLMVVWEANKISDADWDRQYGPDRWDPTARPNFRPSNRPNYS